MFCFTDRPYHSITTTSMSAIEFLDMFIFGQIFPTPEFMGFLMYFRNFAKCNGIYDNRIVIIVMSIGGFV